MSKANSSSSIHLLIVVSSILLKFVFSFGNFYDHNWAVQFHGWILKTHEDYIIYMYAKHCALVDTDIQNVIYVSQESKERRIKWRSESTSHSQVQLAVGHRHFFKNVHQKGNFQLYALMYDVLIQTSCMYCTIENTIGQYKNLTKLFPCTFWTMMNTKRCTLTIIPASVSTPGSLHCFNRGTMLCFVENMQQFQFPPFLKTLFLQASFNVKTWGTFLYNSCICQ